MVRKKYFLSNVNILGVAYNDLEFKLVPQPYFYKPAFTAALLGFDFKISANGKLLELYQAV
jgi:hypothetical protein